MERRTGYRIRDGSGGYRERIYVCSPFRPRAKGPDRAAAELKRNIDRAKKACRMLARLGAIPIAPHLYFTQFLDDTTPEERELGLLLGQELLKGCDELWAFSEHISEGMAQEIAIASKLGIPVRMVCESGELLGKVMGLWKGAENEE